MYAQRWGRPPGGERGGDGVEACSKNHSTTVSCVCNKRGHQVPAGCSSPLPAEKKTSHLWCEAKPPGRQGQSPMYPRTPSHALGKRFAPRKRHRSRYLFAQTPHTLRTAVESPFASPPRGLTIPAARGAGFPAPAHTWAAGGFLEPGRGAPGRGRAAAPPQRRGRRGSAPSALRARSAE